MRVGERLKGSERSMCCEASVLEVPSTIYRLTEGGSEDNGIKGDSDWSSAGGIHLIHSV